MTTLLLGQTLAFCGDPFCQPLEECVRHDSRGGVLIEGGHIVALGHGPDLRRAHPDAAVADHGEALILPGFVDAHMHYPQTGIIASWGKRLIDWLNSYTFPEEMRLADPAYARAQAELTLDLALAHGTTSLLSFCTIHEASVDAWFAAAEARGMRVAGGRTCMDRNAPTACATRCRPPMTKAPA
ncbi:Cytosine deaminase [Rubellimicrobium thermophilum DSM 16684]|uniref:Cytosine deaminase n=1 Tax=Rubellimicrobium thermophilum DSM 16684 TaxID=1123069 RepID=S9R7H6_9RHOB|nr:Cytosine deaminase [Rubellimicrobium thermophilum DSM 16684]